MKFFPALALLAAPVFGIHSSKGTYAAATYKDDSYAAPTTTYNNGFLTYNKERNHSAGSKKYKKSKSKHSKKSKS